MRAIVDVAPTDRSSSDFIQPPPCFSAQLLHSTFLSQPAIAGFAYKTVTLPVELKRSTSARRVSDALRVHFLTTSLCCVTILGMKLLLFLSCALLHYHSATIVPYNWLSLALLSSSDYNPRPLNHGDRAHYEVLCSRLLGLNPVQKAVCIQNPFSIPFVARGIREAIYECQIQFKFERWNCSDRHEITPTPHGNFQDIFGKTLRSTTKETAFLVAIASAGIVHAITKGCNTGNLTDCGCDSKPALQKYVEGDQPGPMVRHEQFSWGGCSDNVPYGQKYARQFLDEYEKQQFEKDRNVSHLVMKHNFLVGREAISQNVRKQCRCHGVSGSCEFKTCWLQMPKFSEVAEMLKKRYDHFAVQVEMDEVKRLVECHNCERNTKKIRTCIAVGDKESGREEERMGKKYGFPLICGPKDRVVGVDPSCGMRHALDFI
ncbi:hypothetical protein Y032_0180g766 [Ancylostoma ceylanicum]|uniref:Protein Wnt n=1 Tax=Ancylostoma ceylanicum TaxID=53326 RepID=A0A016SSB9_9BILA|nr:hypothetical protein Y032_0180g766 [Ancylostoma ceylanicum]